MKTFTVRFTHTVEGHKAYSLIELEAEKLTDILPKINLILQDMNDLDIWCIEETEEEDEG